MIHQRTQSEVFTAGPATWRGNLCVELLTNTVDDAFRYVTKGGASDLNMGNLWHELQQRGGEHDAAATFTHTFPWVVLNPRPKFPGRAPHRR